MTKPHIFRLTCAATTIMPAGAAPTDEVSFLCYQNGNDWVALASLIAAFQAGSVHTIQMEAVGCEVLRGQLANQLKTDAALDVAGVTNLGGLNRHHLDLMPCVDAAYMQAALAQLCRGTAPRW